VAKLYEEPDMSIYLQKVDMEFELGKLVPAVSGEKKAGFVAPLPSSTSAQMKERQ
jgi:hypothetical protein